MQCAQRWEELRTSSLSIAGDYSGLTATGRPISGQGRRQMTRYVRSMFSQQLSSGSSPSRGSYGSGSHGNVMKSSSGYQQYMRQSSGSSTSGASLINIDRPGSGMAVDSILSHHMNDQSGKFVANFCQTHLGSGGGRGVAGGRDHKGKSEDEEKLQKNAASEMTR